MAVRTMQGTTPTFILTLPDTVDLTEAQNVYVTFSQGSQNSLTKSGNDIAVSAHQVDVYMTQKDTLRFRNGTVLIQMNWTFSGGERAATNVVSLDWDENLLQSVVK